MLPAAENLHKENLHKAQKARISLRPEQRAYRRIDP
jgi:hypothetical protein